jgi:GAF domain-containing protein
VSAETPASEAVRTGEPIVLSGMAEIDRRYPDLEKAAEGERSMLCLPLRVAGRRIGAVSMSFPGRRRFDNAELEFFGVLADTCAQAVDRINAVTEAADQAAKLELLAKASAELASSLDYQATLANVARMAVPSFADWCSIQLAEDGVLRTLAVAHVDPDKVALAEELQRRYPADPDAPRGAYSVLRTGVSELVPEVPEELLEAAAQDEEHLRLVRELNLRSALAVPLKARGRVLGVITWVTGDMGRRFGPMDQVFGEDLARRAAVAIDNSRLHSEIRETAVRLQRAVLPEELPPMAGWDFASRYSPAGRTEVGGDFYDVVPLDDGRVAVFVGDVMGRGFAAAAAMSTMRAAVRAYLAVDPTPERVMRRLDVMFAQFDVSQLVTVLYAVLDPERGILTLANAGHPPPVVVRVDGTSQQLPPAESAPLGVAAQRRTQVTEPFRAGDTLLAFTDGLIERRTEDIDLGQRRLLEQSGLLRTGDLRESVERLVEEVRDHTRDDDVAVVAVRRRADS